MAKHLIIPVFVPHLGCPYDCVFCNQKRITGVIGETNSFEVEKTINKHLGTMSHAEGQVEVAFYGGSFTAIPLAKQAELLVPAYKALKEGFVDKIRISTRPDYIDQDILSFLETHGVSIIELGVQSLDIEVLKLSGRGHKRAEVFRATKLIKNQGSFELGLQMMIGLPGDSLAKAKETALEIVNLRPDFVRIYPTLVVKDTPLETLYKKGQYQPLSLDEGVKTTKAAYLIFKKNNVPVIRIGLQPSEEISHDGDVVAGPFHPAFRELVESSIALDKLILLYKKFTSAGNKEVIFEVAPQDVSIVRGQKNSNVKYLKERYGLNKIQVKPNANLCRGEIKLQSSQLTGDLI